MGTEASESETDDSTATQETGETPAIEDPIQLPDDHPLVKTLAQLRAEVKTSKKALEAATTKLRDFEDRDKTDLERSTGRAESAERERDEALAEAARTRAALTHGLSAEDLELLGDGTPDEIEDRARRLAERLAAIPTPPAPANPDPTQGLRDSGQPDLDAQIAQATAEGDVNRVIALNNQKLALAAKPTIT